MNLIQIQNDLKMLPDQALQQQLLRPNGMVPGYLVMSELQRRREMRNGLSQRPQGSMVEEFAQGLGQAGPGGPQQSLAQALATPPGGSQQGGQPGQGLPPLGGMGNPPEGIPGPGPGYADGGEVDGYTGYSPYMTPYQRMLELVRRQRMSMPPGGVMPLPQMPQSGVPAGPDMVEVPDRSWRERGRQVFPGLPKEPSSSPNWPSMPIEPSSRPNWPEMPGIPDGGEVGKMIADSTRPNPPVGPSTDPAPRLMGPSQDIPTTPRSLRYPGVSPGQAMAMSLQGIPGAVPKYILPRTTEGDLQDGPPPERPRMEQGGEPPEWLKQSPFAAALMTPIEGSDTAQFPADRPFTGSPTRGPGMPPTGAPPVARGLPPAGPGIPSGGPPGGSGGGGQGGLLARQPLDDIMTQLTGARGQDRYADLIAQNQLAKDDLAKVRDNDRAMALLTAGLGIMGGTSPDPWTNIGRGALAGVADWNASSKEMRQAQRDLRTADQALAIAQANRDERAVEMAFKQKTHAENLAEQRAMRAATSGAAAGARAEAAADRRARLEMEREDRAERRNMTQMNLYNQQYNQAGQEVVQYQKMLESYSKNPMATPEDKAEAMEGLRNAQNRMRQAEGRMYDFQTQQGIKSGTIQDATKMSINDVMEKIRSGEWPSGTRFKTKEGIRAVP